MEFAACEECNSGTRTSDALAAMLARIGPNMSPQKMKEFRNLADTVQQFAPEALEEISRGPTKQSFERTPDGLYRPVYNVDVEGTSIMTQVAAFATKLGMATFRHLTGRALSTDGLVWTHWVFNGGMTPEKLEAMVSIMPSGATLRQGKVEVSDQFYYRYNSDGHTTIALTAGFHETLWMMAIASCQPDIVSGLRAETRLWPSAVVQPGGLKDLLVGGGPRGRLLDKKLAIARAESEKG